MPTPRLPMISAPRHLLVGLVSTYLISSHKLSVTLASVVLIAVLSLAAIADYLQIRWKSEVKIDQNRDTDRKIMVSFDITFPRLPCFGTF